MRTSIFGWLAVICTGTSLAFGQAPAPAVSTTLPVQGPPRAPAADDGPPSNYGTAPTVTGSAGGGSTEPRFWVNGEYLLWWTKNSPVSTPLVTSSGAAAVVGLPVPGAIGGPGTNLVLGGTSIDFQERSGARFTAGFWLDDERTLGAEANYFFLTPRTITQVAGSNGLTGPNFFIPFHDLSGFTTGGVPGESVGSNPFSPLPSAGPGLGRSGQFSLEATSRLQGCEANGLFSLMNRDGLRVSGLAGFRYLSLTESLTFAAATSALTPGLLIYNTQDSYRASNSFYSAQVGLRAEYGLDNMFQGLFVSATGKFAVGATNETVKVNGQTATNITTGGVGGTTFFSGGSFAQPANVGDHTHDQTAFLPEVTFNVGYQVAGWARLTVGYNFLYISEVALPGSQIDRNINVTQTGIAKAIGVPVAGPPTVPFSFHDSSFWAQGINFGFELQY